jgi:hypothetical protein
MLRSIIAILVICGSGAALAGLNGTITVLAGTDGADVLLNGEKVGTTPLVDGLQVAPGRYKVKLAKPGFVDFVQEVDIEAGAVVDVIADLVASGGVVRLETRASGLVAYVDGRAIGPLPLDITVDPGKHLLEVKNGGERAVFKRSLFVLPGMSLTYKVKDAESVDKSQVAMVNVVSSTDGARVVVESIEVGLVPLGEPLEVPPGTYEVRVEKRGFMPYAETVTVAAGQSYDVFAELTASGAILKVSGHFGARVELDGVEVGIIPFDAEIPAGSHRVVVEVAGAGKLIKSVSVAAGETVQIDYRPSIATAAPVVATVESSRPWYKAWWFWTGTGAVVAGGVATAVVLAMQGPQVPGSDHTIVLDPR